MQYIFERDFNPDAGAIKRGDLRVMRELSCCLDLDGDGRVDTMPQYPNTAFNNARPTVHNNGANVILLDGHVERIAFKKLWLPVDRAGKMHSFWYMED